jgi:pantetheine-phosphate adenylyltransferase
LKNVVAIYPGTFDPVTNGHLDLIQRGSKIFDQLIVSVLINAEKDPLFTLEERLEMLREFTAHYDNVKVDTFGGLLVDYARQVNAKALLRGIRAIMNRKLFPDLETVFMMPAVSYSYVSSRLVKEIARLGGSVTGLVPKAVEERLLSKVNGKSK